MLLQRRVASKRLILRILPIPNVIEIRPQVSEMKHADTSSLLCNAFISVTQATQAILWSTVNRGRLYEIHETQIMYNLNFHRTTRRYIPEDRALHKVISKKRYR
jgi:transcriptional regulator of met regulon